MAQVVSQVVSQIFNANRQCVTSSLSTQSSTLICRICQDGTSPEPLLNACDCSGSIGLVHAMCLEKWLSQSARESCELCHHEFKTIKRIRTFHEFICRPDLPMIEKHYLLADTACFVVLTPLGLASSYLCLRGANQYYNNNDFWAGFALVLLSTFLTLLYIFWVTIAVRYHYRSFRDWQKDSVEVNIVLSDHRPLNYPRTEGDLSNVSNTSNDISDNSRTNATTIDITQSDHSNTTSKERFQTLILRVKSEDQEFGTENEYDPHHGSEETRIMLQEENESRYVTRVESNGQEMPGDVSTDHLLSTSV